jgi:hypothetical protein
MRVVGQNYFMPVRRLSNPPELCKSGGENRHLATLAQCRLYFIDFRLNNFDTLVNIAQTLSISSHKTQHAHPAFVSMIRFKNLIRNFSTCLVLPSAAYPTHNCYYSGDIS